MSGHPDSDRDHPLSCHWRPVAPDAYASLKLPPTRSKAATIARAQIITEAFVIGRADDDAWVSYSRRRAFYAAHRGRYWPTTYTYDAVVPAVDQLANNGFLTHEKMPSGNLGRQSRFKASAELIKLLNREPFAVIHDPRERVILRDKDGRPVDYTETEGTHRWRRNLHEINQAILSTAIGLRGSSVCEGDPLQVAGTSFGAASSQLHRVFNRGSFDLGGRFYGPWWQNIPSPSRAEITINGVQTVELDYPRLHPTLLYAEVGKSMPGDAYDLANWPRDLVKIAFNTLVSADTRLAALRSIANKIGGEGAYDKATALVCEIEAKHEPIAPKFGSGAGLRLMRRDSDMTEWLLLRLLKRGVVALPIHDSYVVCDRTNEKGALMEGMAEALYKSVGDNDAPSVAYRKSIPQYGAYPLPLPGAPGVGGRVPVGCVVVFFPVLPQRDLFGADTLAVPVSAVLGWNGGRAPREVQEALRHEMRRRGLRHADVAWRVGISRPQFENILQRRFGASQDVAERIRNFLIEGAKTIGTAA